MAYSDYTFEMLRDRLGVTVREVPGLFDQIAPLEYGSFLQMAISRHLPMMGGLNSEKGRSEWLIAPVLSELRELRRQNIAVFSGAEFSVDWNDGLVGYCDFLISSAPIQSYVEAPVVTLVEAKREDLTAGTPQCIAEMVAAKRFNARRNVLHIMPYGVVSSGTEWRFLRLENEVALIDTKDLYITDAGRILGILSHMLDTGLRTPDPAA